MTILEQVTKVNQELPLHDLWDGFWIYEFYEGKLTITCSFDSIYYRNFDILFEDVIFFNVPLNWRDTDVKGNNLLRIADKAEFLTQQPNFDTAHLTVFAIDLHQFNGKEYEKHSYYIVAKSVALIECSAGDNVPGTLFIDPYPDDSNTSKRNKIKS